MRNERWDNEVGAGRRRGRRGRRAVRLLRTRPAARRRLRGRPARRLPTPFGLVRAGVAPDHPKIKSVTRVYEKTARHAGLPLLRRRRARRATSPARSCSSATTRSSTRSAPRTTTGSGSRARTGPARTRPPSSSPGTTATRTTPTTSSTSPPSAPSSIGNGNVAIDVARMLVLDPDELAATDTADHAIEALGAAPVQRGRRARPPRAGAGRVHQPRAARAGRADARRRRGRPGRPRARRRAPRGSRPRATRRPGATSRCCASTPRASRTGKPHRVALRFLRSPVEILGEGEDGPVTGVRVARNRIEPATTAACAPCRPARRRSSSAASCSARSATAAGRSTASRSTSAAA